MNIRFSNDDFSAFHDFAPALGDDAPGIASYASAGPVPITPLNLGPTGILRLEFFESFDDFPGAADGVWSGALARAGQDESIVTVHYIPAPAPALALGALLATALRRRRP
jgi:hypothetical protein